MFTPLLETKFYVPRPRPGLVPRLRLSERLDRGAASTLLLVSAPAGFGKTTLLIDWLAAKPTGASDERSVAWLSLDQGDNDPASFWTYVIAALRTVAPGVGASTVALLQEPSPPPIPTLLTPLLNDLDAIARDLVLVLDDYHVIEARDVHQGMEFLLDHVPEHVHLVIATRVDPPLPLARLRARGQLVETRASDLRFTPDEATEYLNGSMGLQLATPDVTALEGRTEGWIAALQLAALSVQGRDDVAEFIAGFAGDDRYVVDYLVEEVVQRQPDRVQNFLLQTSILARLSGPLCDAVTGQSGGKAMLDDLDRRNLFLVPLDDRRRWYRYHHLFADVLRSRLLDEQPDCVQDLHRRASAWYEQNGERSVAIAHALAAEDFERAAALVEKSIPELRRDRHESTLLGWVEVLPDDVVRARPVLSVGYAGALLASGRLEGVESRLRDAEQLLDAAAATPARPGTSATEIVVTDEAELRRLPTWIALFRAAQALMLGDLLVTEANARRALDLAVEDDHLGRGAAAGLLGLAAWAKGDLEAGHRSYTDCVASLLLVGHISDVLGCTIALADIRIAQGRLHDAFRTYEQALQLAAENDGPPLRGAADMYVGISEIQCERDDLTAATKHLQTSQDLGEHIGMPQNKYRWCVAMARIRQAEGDLDGAVDLLEEAERLYVGDFFPYVRPVPAMRARVLSAQGRIREAFDWVREQGLTAEDELSYLREYEHVTLASLLLAQYGSEREEQTLAEAIELLERLLHAAREGGRTGVVIEIRVLLALSHQLRGDIPAALASLEPALALAEPEGYVRIFAEEGSRMESLLEVAAKRGIAPHYVRRLLAAGGRGEDQPATPQALIDPLSERELDVLRLLRSDLGGPDIARELFLSLNTVRSHTKKIYAKLGVNNRRAAVRRAEELDLLSRSGSQRG